MLDAYLLREARKSPTSSFKGVLWLQKGNFGANGTVKWRQKSGKAGN